jgi:hypothetical protein
MPDSNFFKDTIRSINGGIRGVMNVLPGAHPRKQKAADPIVVDVRGGVKKADLRVKIVVPPAYLASPLTNPLGTTTSIMFPYTPSISYDHKAEYTSQNPTHSNFSLYFYKNSSISAINITGKFTVQNDEDAQIYLGTLHLLRALTKMRSGGASGDTDSGAPPPICRLFAYGDYMLDNVPVAIGLFKVELPDAVDYYTTGAAAFRDNATAQDYARFGQYGQAFVPTLSTISITCIPMYSRAEMQKFSVTGWLGSGESRFSGIL